MEWLDKILNNASKLVGTYLETDAQKSAAKNAAASSLKQPFDWKPVAYIGGGVVVLLAVVYLFKK